MATTKIEPGSEAHFALLGAEFGYNFLGGSEYRQMQAFAKKVWEASRSTLEVAMQEPVAQVDEGDEGLFVQILYGANGSPLKFGDKLYTHPVVAGGSEVARPENSFHAVNAESGSAQGVEPATYTDAQLAAGVTALEFCRSRGIPLSDETVAGIIYDYMTAAA